MYSIQNRGNMVNGAQNVLHRTKISVAKGRAMQVSGGHFGQTGICCDVSLQSPQHNQLLASLSPAAFKSLSPHLELVAVPYGMVLCESGEAVQYVYFPTDCIVSLLNVLEDGASAQIAMVGDDGMIGVSLLMDVESAQSRAVVLSAGHAYCLPGNVLKEEIHRSSELRTLLLRYTQALIWQMAQTAVCNRHHTLDQQVCRWLLMSLDRVRGSELKITQEVIANMLGVRRESVTEAAGRLRNQGAIRYARGRIEVLNRPRLEALCCECYAVVRKQTDRIRALAWQEPFGQAQRSPGSGYPR